MYTEKEQQEIIDSFECENCQAMHLMECVCLDEENENCYKCGEEIEVSGLCGYCEMEIRDKLNN